jgi:LytTr DNA-binding domain-containing protein
MALIRKYFAPGVIVVVVLAALFAFLGIYDTDEMPFPERFTFWSATIGAGLCAAAFVAPWVYSHSLRHYGPAVQLPVIAAISSLPVTIVLAGFDTGFTRPWPLANWALQYSYSMVVSLFVVTGGYIVLKAFGFVGETSTSDAVGASPAQKFLERLPMNYRAADLYAVSSEDHYLRVHTDRGEHLILMRISDALRELEGADGLQIHRSWWVARIGVAELNRDNGKLAIILKTGREAPISRSFSKAVRDANFGSL